MRRPSAMLLLSVPTRWARRSSASGALPARRDLMRAASSLAEVSSAPSSSCRLRARRLRSSSRAVCRWWVSSVSCTVRCLTSISSRSRSACSRRCCSLLLQLECQALTQVHVQRQQSDGTERGNADAAEQQRAVDVVAARGDTRRLLGQQLGAERADAVHLFLADVAEHDVAGGVLAPLLVQSDGQRQLRQPRVRHRAQLLQPRHRLGFVGVVALQEAERGVDLAEGLVVRQQVFVAFGEQIAALAGFGVEEAALQTLQAAARRGHRTQRVERAHRTPVRAFADEQHDRRRGQGQCQDQRVALDYRSDLHVALPSTNVGSCSEERSRTP